MATSRLVFDHTARYHSLARFTHKIDCETIFHFTTLGWWSVKTQTNVVSFYMYFLQEWEGLFLKTNGSFLSTGCHNHIFEACILWLRAIHFPLLFMTRNLKDGKASGMHLCGRDFYCSLTSDSHQTHKKVPFPIRHEGG